MQCLNVISLRYGTKKLHINIEALPGGLFLGTNPNKLDYICKSYLNIYRANI